MRPIKGGLEGKTAWPNKEDLVEVKNKFFAWPGEAEKAARWALQESGKGREVYQCGHLLTGRRRVKENAVPPMALFADGDGAKIPDWMPPPDVVIESSPDREQYYWILNETMAPEVFEDLNKRLTYAIGADKGKWARSTLLRVPGTRNHKYEDAPVVRVERM